MVMKKKWLFKKRKNDYLSGAYASRNIIEPIPEYSFPSKSMPSAVAYQLIHEELSLDGCPELNLASFVTTWMEPEVKDLMALALNKNLVDRDEYPQASRIEKRCVHMLAQLFYADDIEKHSIGAATVGSSEAVMLAGLAMKFSWKKRQKLKSLPTDNPNIIMGANVQVVWEKFARYFEVEPRYVPLAQGRYVISPEDAISYCDENTIGVVGILGSTFNGEYEPIELLNQLLEKFNAERGLNIPIHVDAASGGFVAPFLTPKLKWDFRLSLVKSINVSGHKYGLVYPGCGWVLWRSKSELPEELVFHVNYLGGDMPTFNLNFSRPSAYVIAQYYNFIRLGFEGYKRIMKNLQIIAIFLQESLEKYPFFHFINKTQDLPVLTWEIDGSRHYSAYDFSALMRERGWIIPAYSMPKNIEKMVVLRVVIREGMTMQMAGDLLTDIAWAVDTLEGEIDSSTGVDSKAKHKIC